MKIWEKPPIYTIIHVATGIVGYFFPIVLVVNLFYQFLQYSLDVRFFVFEGTYKEGNSFEHTTMKLLEVAYGYNLANRWLQV